jgi:UDP-2,3-diacylglucosamine pyrophosphatase LpxH
MTSMKGWMLICLLLTGFTAVRAQNTDGDEDPITIIRGPYLQVGSPTAMTIRWRTNVATRSRVRFGATTGNWDQVKDDSTITTEHIVRISGLQPHTRYYYTVGTFADTLQGDANNFFYTLPATGSTGLIRVGAFGDCGNNSPNQRNVKQSVLNYLGKNYMDAWILLGDNAYGSGTDQEYQTKFFNIYGDDLLKQHPVYPTPGNHDYQDRDFPGAVEVAVRTHKTAYYQNFSMPTEGEAGGVPSHAQSHYSFDIGNVHFISLDSYGKESEQYRLYDTLGPQAQWVKKDLAANKNKQWVIAFWHHPPYTMGSHNSDNTNELIGIRENFIRILEREGVDLIICGHSHDYERTRLIHGHYGTMDSFDPAVHNLSQSSGMYDGSNNSCPYVKDSLNRGTVYVVSGSAGKLGGRQTTYPHKAMQYANDQVGGASMLEIENNRLDLKWINSDGQIRDQFTIMKEVNKRTVLKVKTGQPLTLTASFVGNYKWSEKNQTTKTITIKPKSGTTTITVADKEGCVKDTFIITAR